MTILETGSAEQVEARFKQAMPVEGALSRRHTERSEGEG